ncbi:hypothetical protein [Lactococcus allomyrinae]|uniref:Uncharacterized protein n=1 Tax=Lactococcus allomyrinae TaxID=2419773 RepID=A0A387BJ87_9LACT|nr:hypothetical protein [Lactococcus allomyrinae]AYG00990.1 hypothetical protein D7I46_07755 [Lactococcus allomyrinae]
MDLEEQFFQLEKLDNFSAVPAISKTEITDPLILSKINNLLVTTGKNIQAIEHSKVMAQQNQKLLKDVYRVTIPKGTELLTKNSGQTTGLLVKEGTRNSIKGFANLEKINLTELASGINPATAAFEVASMVTAQHYMAEIETELKAINGKLDALVNLQKNDIVGNLKSISQEVENLSKYSSENILDKDTRNIKRKSIEDFRVQVNKEFQKSNDFLNQNVEFLNSEDLKIKEEHIADFQFWTQIQTFSLNLLEELAKLEFQYSSKNSNARKQAFSIYEKNIEKAQNIIKQIEAYSIYHSGIKSIQSKLSGWGQKKIDEKINFPIRSLQNIKYMKFDSEKLIALESNSVELILEDGKVYYLPEKIEEK